MAQTPVLVISSVTSGSSICVAFGRLPTVGWTGDEQQSVSVCDKIAADGL
jgi:hypothetical protein